MRRIPARFVHRHRRHGLNPLARAVAAVSAAGLLAAPMWLQASPALPGLPQGLQVVQGQASVATQGALMTVKNSNNAILNWHSFNIGAGAGVHFQQADAASKVLNRVVGHDPSAILGNLSSNGQVWLLNPNGVLFGPGARVDVAGLVASTLRLNDNHFLAGRYRFNALGSDHGTLRNEGSLRSSFGGQVVLLGSRVENTGSVVAEGGSVVLAAARSVELVDTGLPHLAVKVELAAAADGAVANLGRLAAPGGKIDVYAGIVNQQGLVQADSLGSDALGRVSLQAAVALNLAEGSTTQAAGGTLRLDAGANGLAAVHGSASTAAPDGAGGDLLLQGRHILVGATAVLDASGAAGGGLLRVGGDFQGKNALVRHAEMVTVRGGAQLRADATGAGDGGTVIVWSDSATRFGGHASAKGGPLGGHGGLVEVSAKGYLDYRGSADLRAAAGREGLLLLDPTNLTIQLAGPDIDGSGGGGDDLVTPTLAFAAPGLNSIITAAAVATQLASANVTLQATNDITLATALNSASANGLTLQAGNNINLNAAVTLGGALTLSANDPGGPASGSGRVASNAGIDIGAAALSIGNNGGGGTHTLGNLVAAGSLAVVGNVQLVSPLQLNLGAGLSTLPGVISGGVNEALTKLGAGTLVLSASNTYAGGTLVNAGTLRLAGAAVAPGTGLVSLGGGTLDLSDGATLTNDLSVGFGASGLGNSSGAATITGNVALNGNLALNGSGSGLLISGIVGGSTGALDVNSGTLTLSAGSSGYSGISTVNGGTLRVAGAGATLGGSLTVQAGATLDIANGANMGFGAVSSAGGTIGSSAGTGTLNGVVSTLGGVNTFGIAGPGLLVVNADVSGSSAGVSIAGPVSFITASTYAGGTSITPTGVLTIDGPLAGVNGAINVGAGRLAVASTASVPNALTINGGQLETTSSGSFSGPITLNGNVRLVVGGGTSVLDIDSAISGPGGIVVPASGAGSITLGGANTYTGTTALTGGALQLINGAAIPNAGAVTLAAGSTLRLLSAETIGSLAGPPGSTVDLGNVALSTGGDNTNTVFAGVFTGGTGPQLVKQGSGVFTLSGSSSVSAPVTVTAGTLQISGVTANAGLGGINLGAAGTLDIVGGASVANTVQMADGATISSSGGNGTLAAGTLLLPDGITLNLVGSGLGPLTVARLIPNVAGGAPESVNVSGGRVALTALNTYTGGTTLAGTAAVFVGSSTALGSGAATVPAGTTLNVGNGVAVGNALTLSGGSLVNDVGVGVTTGAITLTGNSFLSSGGSGLFVQGAMGGSGGVVVNGSGNVNLTAANTYAGATTVASGTLTTGTANVLPDATVLGVAVGATVVLGGNDTIGGLTHAGSINLGANTLSLNNAGAATVSGSIAGSGGLNKTGAGSLTVTGALGYTGTTLIDQGSFIVDSALTLSALTLNNSGDLGGAGALTISGPFTVAGSSKTLGGSGALVSQGASSVNLGNTVSGTVTLTRPWTNSGALTLGGDDSLALAGLAGASLTNAVGATLLLASSSATAVTAASGNAVINNQGTLLKSSAGSTDLGSSGATSFSNSGLVSVSGGTLGVLGSFTQTGVIDVGSGATFLAQGLTNAAGAELRGNGSIGVFGASPLLNQGLISPGGSGVVGTLTFTGALDLGSGTLEIDLAGAGAGSFDQVISSGATLQLGGTLLATLRGGYTPVNADFMPVLLASGSVSGSFGNTSLPGGFVAGYGLAAGEAVRLIYANAGSTRIFTNAAGNLDWSTPANWSGILPGPADEALISSGFAVNHAGGIDTIAALTVNAANSLLVSGGSLSVTGATLLGGSLAVAGSGVLTLGGAVSGGGAASVSGGTLTLGGAASFASFVMSGGAVGGAGSLGVVGNFNRSGGVINSGLSSISLTQNSGALVLGGALAAGSVTLNSLDPAQPLNVPAAVTAFVGDVVLSGAEVNVGGVLSGQRVLIDGGNGVQFNAGASAAATLAGGEAIVVESGGFFRNLAGASVFSVGGAARWLVYSADPGLDTTGALVPAFKQYGAAIGAAPAAAGNGLLYALAPTLSATLQGAVDKVYDTTSTATLLPANFVLGGALAGDTVTLSSVASGSYTTAGSGSTVAGVGTGKTVAATGLSVVATDTVTGAPVFGYLFGGTASGTVGSITPAALLLTGYSAGNKVYDGSVAALIAGSGGFTALGGDSVTLTGTASGSFADKNVGSAKAVTLAGLGLAGPDAANYTLVLPTTLVADITARALNVTGLLALNRVYDATTAATLGGTAVLNSVAGDAVTLAGAATAAFADKNVGSAKPVTLSGLGLAGADAGNYTLVAPAGLSANITPRPLTVAGLSAANKVYDAGTTATLAGTPAVTPLAGDALSVAGTALGSFADANVGTAKPLLLAGLTLGGADGANYTPVAPATLVASITPASLNFVAAALTAPASLPLPALGGTVTGFVGADTQASATTGTLAFTSNATPASAPGRYSIDGGGLVAQNYVFTQAAGNATALTLTPAPTTAAQSTNVNLAALVLGLQNVQVTLAMSTPTEGRVLDVLPALAGSGTTGGPGGAGGAGAPVFRAMNYSLMPRPEVQSLMAARERYKKQVFASGLYKLDQDPTLADVRPCRTEAELNSGNCLITEALKLEIQQIQARAARAAPGTAAQQAAARQPERRRVRQAALPNIQRKLALLIGVNSYRDKRVPALEGAVPDARAVRTLLENRLGYEATVLEDPSRETIIRAFNKIALEADANDSVIIYYAGHGVVIPVNGVDTGYWLPSDTNAEEPGSWLSNADIAKMVAAVGSRQLMLVSDSCYSGSLVGNEKVQLSQSTNAGDLLSRKAAVVLSSGGNEPVADEGRDGHSIFAWHFMRALENVDNWQVGGNVFERVRAAVNKEFPQTPQYGASRPAGHQGNTDFLYERREIEAAAPAPVVPAAPRR